MNYIHNMNATHIYIYICNYTIIHVYIYNMCKIDWCKNNNSMWAPKKDIALAFASGQSSASNWQVCDTKTEMEDIRSSNSTPGIHQTPMKNWEMFAYQLVNQISSETWIMPGGESETNQFWEPKFTDFAHDMTELTKSGWILIIH